VSRIEKNRRHTVLLYISGHKALLSQLLDPREDLLLLGVVVASDNLVPALAIANEVFVIFRLDMRSLEVNAGLR
jgi:low temperature requirement protein LtrA